MICSENSRTAVATPETLGDKHGQRLLRRVIVDCHQYVVLTTGSVKVMFMSEVFHRTPALSLAWVTILFQIGLHVPPSQTQR